MNFVKEVETTTSSLELAWNICKIRRHGRKPCIGGEANDESYDFNLTEEKNRRISFPSEFEPPDEMTLKQNSLILIL